MKALYWKRIGYVFVAALLITWSAIVYIYTPEGILAFMGIENGYLFLFVAGALGGTSILVPFPYIVFVVTFAAGGLNPFLTGLAAGLGVMIGDSTSYLLGRGGRDILPTKAQDLSDRLLDWTMDQPPSLVPVALFLYASVVPMSNDLLIIPLGMAKYPYKSVMIPMGIGSIVFNTLLAYSTQYGMYLLF